MSTPDRPAVLVFAKVVSRLAEHVLGERLLDNLVNLHLVAPAERRNQHRLCVLYPQLPA